MLWIFVICIWLLFLQLHMLYALSALQLTQLALPVRVVAVISVYHTIMRMILPAVPPPSPTSIEAGDDKTTPIEEGGLIGWGSDGRVANTQLMGLNMTTSPCAQWQDHLRSPDPETKRLISATWGNGAPKWICVHLIPDVGWLEPGDSGGAYFIHR
jgi:hypothetical protein